MAIKFSIPWLKGRVHEVGTVHNILILNSEDIEHFLNMKEVLKVVELAFKNEAEGKTIMPSKLYLDLSSEWEGDFRAMPAYVDGACGIKWVCVYPENPTRGLKTVCAVIIYSDPQTGYPLAFMDGTVITDMRTGACGGVAVKYLARHDSEVVGLIGAGRQARTQLSAIKEVLPGVAEVKVFEPKLERRDAVATVVPKMKSETGLDIRLVESIQEACAADVVVTTTPARQPLIKNCWISPGTHINAIGADAPGKQELESALLKRARIVVDNVEQASHSGEINVPVSKGEIRLEDLYATLGEVVSGLKKGRESDDDITIFDSTGLAIQDIATAKIAYEKAIGSRKEDLRRHQWRW